MLTKLATQIAGTRFELILIRVSFYLQKDIPAFSAVAAMTCATFNYFLFVTR